jgi:hypothetical protein
VVWDGVMSLVPDLGTDLAGGDAAHKTFLDAADAYASSAGPDLPGEPDARVVTPFTRDRSETRGASTPRMDRPTQSRSCSHWVLVIKFCILTERSGDLPCSQGPSASS